MTSHPAPPKRTPRPRPARTNVAAASRNASDQASHLSGQVTGAWMPSLSEVVRTLHSRAQATADRADIADLCHLLRPDDQGVPKVEH